MTEKKRPGIVMQFVKRFIGRIGLLFFPLPIGLFRRQLAGRTDDHGELQFFSHPDFVCTMHLIWVGWLVTLGEFYNQYASDHQFTQIPNGFLSWPWLFVLTVTLIVMGLQFARVAVGFLIAAIVITGLILFLSETLSEVAVFHAIHDVLKKIPVTVDWGVPMVVSLVLGLVFVSMASWRRMNDCWSLKARGNYLEHENFQEKDRTISKGAKTFVAVFPCILRRYLLFGYGNIEVRSSTGTSLVYRIEGVFYARHHADIIKNRFSVTDTHDAEAEEEEAEEEAATDELL